MKIGDDFFYRNDSLVIMTDKDIILKFCDNPECSRDAHCLMGVKGIYHMDPKDYYYERFFCRRFQ